MTSKDAQCFVGGLFSEKRYTKSVNDKEVNKELKDSHAQATYARLWNAYDEIISGRSRLSPLEKTAAVIERLTDVPVDSVSMFLRNPSGILGDDVVKAVEAIGQDHFHRYKGTDKAAWRQVHKPQIEALRAKVMAGIDPVYDDYAKKYFDFYSDGGRMYARRGNLNPVDKLVRNVVGNVVVWNPTIGIMNLFEVAPKGLAYAIEHGNPVASIQALTNVLQKTGGNVFKRLPEYEALGIYNRVEGVHKFSPVETTETFLRNYAAELGTLTGNGHAHGLENIAFVNRFGNEPQANWTNQGSATITLMRYSIASTKFYLSLLGKAAQGDINAAMAFAAFSAVSAIQTGGISALPAPMTYILKQGNPQAYRALKQLDETAPYLNLSKHLGIDIAGKMQPVGGLALGVGYDILNQDLGNATRDFGKVPGDIAKGRPGLATARLIDGMFAFGQLGSIPGVNLTTKRLVKAVVDEVEKERQVTVDGYFKTAVQHLGLTAD